LHSQSAAHAVIELWHACTRQAHAAPASSVVTVVGACTHEASLASPVVIGASVLASVVDAGVPPLSELLQPEAEAATMAAAPVSPINHQDRRIIFQIPP
jgi:hypothetical protein